MPHATKQHQKCEFIYQISAGNNPNSPTRPFRSALSPQPPLPLPTLLEKITITVQSWVVHYFHNRIIGNHCTFPARLTFVTIRIVPEILLTTNYNILFVNYFHYIFGTMVQFFYNECHFPRSFEQCRPVR